MSDVTRLLESAAAGDRQAAADPLFPLIYGELSQLAATRTAAARPGQPLRPTALVHEAHLRSIGDRHFNGRERFVVAMTDAVRRLLVGHDLTLHEPLL